MTDNAEARRQRVRQLILSTLDLRPYIGGSFVDPMGDERLAVLDPTLGDASTEMPLGTEQDAARAVAAARKAFDSGIWSELPGAERAKPLNALADLIEEHLEDLALLEAMDVGKAVAGVRAWDIPNGAEVYRFYAQLAGEPSDSTIAEQPNFIISNEPRPIGVCVAIVPWNFPFPNIAWKVAPALAAGCTVVVKPAERAPLSAQFLARLASEAGFPPGVFNVVMGTGERVGAALVSDPHVNKITFTGSSETGREIVSASARHLPRLTLELGGKNPNVVMADADLDVALPGTIDAMFAVAGQNCCAGSRTLVHADVYDEFMARLVPMVEARRLGDPLDDATEQGPQIDGEHLERIRGYVDGAIADGASRATGGVVMESSLLYPPTVITGAPADSRIAREEVFGPVGCVFRFSSNDEALEMANDTEFGLSSSVWTRDKDFADQFVAHSRVGTCWVNCFGLFETVAPWGGTKGSGYGRELGADAMSSFLDGKTVFRAR